MKTKIIIVLFAALFLYGCPGGMDSGTGISLSNNSIVVNQGSTVVVNITIGTAPYSVSTGNSSIATASISGSTVRVVGVSPGNTIIGVTGGNGSAAYISVAVVGSSDPDAAFKADAALRFEGAGGATIRESDATHLFYADKGGLFSSTKNKVGYATRSGSVYYFVEWTGDASVGSKSSPSLRTQGGTSSLYSLDVVQYKDGKLWIKYKQTSGSAEGRVVQNW
ncbi:MAG: hypothetical protein LBC84_07440 [Prevotellaceae bacterium]|jgi:hypothetical protein|nr:hypothetical protein [Prevotellaceae bacterium]